MDFWFLLKCFLIGLSASSTVGPIFILTFNRGALYGFWKGTATACGSALADGIFFALGLLGALELIGNSKQALLVMDLIGGTFLIIFGIMTLKSHHKNLSQIPADMHILLALSKAFVLTILNPFVALFFILVSLQILPDELSRLPLNQIIISSFMVFCGSLTVLSFIALIGHLLGNAINKNKLKIISYVTGIIFISVGTYLTLKFFYFFTKGDLIYAKRT